MIRILTLSIVLAALILATTAAVGQTMVITKYTVIPVILQTPLSSATSKVGDTLTATCMGTNCGGFPLGTTFLGRVTDVTRAGKGTPGQIGVNFYQAILPDKMAISIVGDVTSLNQQEVAVDPNTGIIYELPQERNERNKFISQGAGAGAIIGAIGSSNNAAGFLKGAAIGGVAGWIASSAIKPQQVYGNLALPPGTTFGVLLNQDVQLQPAAVQSGVGAGPGTIFTLQFSRNKPFVGTDGVIMVPFSKLFTMIGIPHNYVPETRTLYISSQKGQIVHTIGTQTATVGNTTVPLKSQSKIVGGVIYIPSDLIQIATNKNVSWDANTGTLTLK